MSIHPNPLTRTFDFVTRHFSIYSRVILAAGFPAGLLQVFLMYGYSTAPFFISIYRLIFYIFAALWFTALIYAVASEGNAVLSNCYRNTFKKYLQVLVVLLPYLGFWFLQEGEFLPYSSAWFYVLLALLVLVVLVRCLIFLPVIFVVEEKGLIDSIHRSMDLIQGKILEVFMALIAVHVVIRVVSYLLALLLFLPINIFWPDGWWLLMTIIQGVISPLLSGLYAVVIVYYYQQQAQNLMDVHNISPSI